MLASGRGSHFQALADAARAGALPIQLIGLFSDRPDAPALIRELDATTHVPVRHLRGPAAPLIARLP